MCRTMRILFRTGEGVGGGHGSFYIEIVQRNVDVIWLVTYCIIIANYIVCDYLFANINKSVPITLWHNLTSSLKINRD